VRFQIIFLWVKTQCSCIGEYWVKTECSCIGEYWVKTQCNCIGEYWVKTQCSCIGEYWVKTQCSCIGEYWVKTQCSCIGEYIIHKYLRKCVTSRKVGISISDEAIRIYLSGSTMGLGSTLPLTKMSTRDFSWKVRSTGAWGWQPCHIYVPTV
jgi:hypothetical protein